MSELADITANHGHVPVMLQEMTDLLAPAITNFAGTPVVIDGTLGAGGHTEFFLTTFPQLHVIGIDRDANSLAQATKRLEPFAERFHPYHGRFDEIEAAIAATPSDLQAQIAAFGLAGGFFDLGVSSMQIDQPERGFSYRFDAPLDMRMDDSQTLTAAAILNTYSHGELARVLKTYGDERFASKIASAIIKEREQNGPWGTTGRLVELLYATIPAAARRTGGHPAKRTFQALRIEVNRELEAIEQMLPALTERIGNGGRIVIMSYQSLEDKLVKRWFTELTTSKTPPGLPLELPEYAPKFRKETKGALMANEQEKARNPRAGSVRARAVARIDGYQGRTS